MLHHRLSYRRLFEKGFDTFESRPSDAAAPSSIETRSQETGS
jgi:hypothetical protein